MKTLVFAYGSNMKTDRMVKRVPSAKVVGKAFIANKKIQFNKKSKDGSGKANIMDSPGDVVWGVLYEVDSKQLSDFDRIEGGYNRINVGVTLHNGKQVEAQTYHSGELINTPVPFDWYKNMIIQGACEHKLPQDYIDCLKRIPSIKYRSPRKL